MTIKSNNRYSSPVITVLEVIGEGVLCGSPYTGQNEDIQDDPTPFVW